MKIDFGVKVNDCVTIPVEWSNITDGLPNGHSVAARVSSVSGPVATLETQFGAFKFATISVVGWYK